MDFSFYPLRFHFQALGPIYFPPGQSANILRGGFGLMLREHSSKEVYQRVFEPSSESGPSGLKNWPRPFVFRTSHLDGQRFAAGERFHFEINLFDTRSESVLGIRQAFEELGRAGFGPGRAKADLLHEPEPQLTTIELSAGGDEVFEIRVDFLTPLELKADEEVTSDVRFQVLFARIRDRVSTLRTLYGPGPLTIDFKELGHRAAQICTIGGQLSAVQRRRRSSRTGQVHEIGGVTGWADYAGDLGEFVPYLRAAEYCGVGRQCVWGKGQIQVSVRKRK